MVERPECLEEITDNSRVKDASERKNLLSGVKILDSMFLRGLIQ